MYELAYNTRYNTFSHLRRLHILKGSPIQLVISSGNHILKRGHTHTHTHPFFESAGTFEILRGSGELLTQMASAGGETKSKMAPTRAEAKDNTPFLALQKSHRKGIRIKERLRERKRGREGGI